MKRVSAIDRHVAARLRAARLSASLSQEKAAELLGLTFQQVQKYEKAVNRISIGKLVLLAAAYRRPLAWFVEGAPGVDGVEPSRDLGAELLATPRGRDLAEAFLTVDAATRSAVVNLLCATADVTVPRLQAAE